MFKNNTNELERARKDCESHFNDRLEYLKENLKHLSLDITKFLDSQLLLSNRKIKVKNIGNELFLSENSIAMIITLFDAFTKNHLLPILNLQLQ